MAKNNKQLSAAITVEVKRGDLRRFYVKQVESGDAGEFSRMTDEELRAFIAHLNLSSIDAVVPH